MNGTSLAFRTRLRLGSVVIMAALAAGPSWAQSSIDPVPRDPQAEAVFELALQNFEAENYAEAYLRFREVYEQYRLHRKTTAAVLMAGKALYRNGDYQRAVDLLSAFLSDYPTSSYRTSAGRTLGFAQQKVREMERGSEALRLGIILPMSRDDLALTQALFNGIRLAVDEHNRNAAYPVQMVFRNTENTATGARQAVMSLADAGVDAIMGPLYSGEAQAAARAAEQAGIVLIAPLATDDGIARNRRHVFQANPTIPQRGAAMARWAVQARQARTVGIIAESGNSISERMAEGFQEEAFRLGAEVSFFELLPTSRDWAQVPDRVGPEALASVDAVYLPVHRAADRDAHRLIEETLNSLSRVASVPPILGGSKWHDVPFKGQASAFDITYTDVFYVDDALPEVSAFKSRYRDLTQGRQPGRLAYVGYDVTAYLIQHMARSTGTDLSDLLREADLYQGLGTRIQFGDAHTNEALFLLHYENANIVLLQ